MTMLLELQKLENNIDDYGVRYFSGGSCVTNSCGPPGPTRPYKIKGQKFLIRSNKEYVLSIFFRREHTFYFF